MSITDKTDEEMSKLEDLSHPILILVRGLPGSGKSYLAVAIQESIGKDRAVVIDPDKIDLSSKEYTDLSTTLTAEGVDSKFHPYRFLRSKAYKAIISHQIIIWNQAFTNLDGFNKTIINLQAFAAEQGTRLPVLVVEVEVNEAIARERVAKREEQGGHGVSEGAFARFISEYESFADKGYNIVAVHGENDVAVSVSSVTKALEDLPE